MVAKITCCCFPFIFSLLLSICVGCLSAFCSFVFIFFFFIHWKFIVFFYFIWILLGKGAGCFNMWNNLFGFLSVSIRFQIIEFCYRFHGSQLNNNNNNWSLTEQRQLIRNSEFDFFGAPKLIVFCCLLNAFCSRHNARPPTTTISATFAQCSMSNLYSNSMIENKKFLTTQQPSMNKTIIPHWTLKTFSELTNPIFEQFPTERFTYVFMRNEPIYRSIVRLIDNDINWKLKDNEKRCGREHGAKTKDKRKENIEIGIQHDFIIHGR